MEYFVGLDVSVKETSVTAASTPSAESLVDGQLGAGDVFRHVLGFTSSKRPLPTAWLRPIK